MSWLPRDRPLARYLGHDSAAGNLVIVRYVGDDAFAWGIDS